MESDVCGAIEFPQWLGKNSNKGKRHRLLQALHTHVHIGVRYAYDFGLVWQFWEYELLQIWLCSGSLEALNMDYLPYMRRKICDPLIQGNTDDATEFMEVRTSILSVKIKLWQITAKHFVLCSSELYFIAR